MTIDSFLTSPLPDSCKFNWKSEWGRVIIVRLKNSPGNNTNYENFKLTIAPIDGFIFGMLKSEITKWDSHDDKWFGNQANLGELNKDVYSSPAKIFVYKDFETNDKFFSYYWHNKFDRLEEGQLPSNLTPDKLTRLLNGKLFSGLYTYLKSL
jgi:hypothetical protein